MAPPREQYARAWSMLDGLEVHVGLEFHDDEDPEETSDLLMDFLGLAFEMSGEDMDVVRRIEQFLVHEWPGRAYYIETEREGRGIQVFQPYGLPKNDERYEYS